MASRSTTRTRGRPGARRIGGSVAALALASSLLAACGGDSGTPSLNWYVNPDGVDTFRTYAEKCSTDAVRHRGPAAAGQRDRPAHPARAAPRSRGLLDRPDEPRPGLRRRVRQRRLAPGGARGARVRDHRRRRLPRGRRRHRRRGTTTVYAIPLWANTQVLWYRKSLAEAAGLDMGQPRHLGPGHRGRGRRGRHRRRAGQPLRGLRRVDQRADAGRGRRHRHRHRGRARRRASSSTARPARRPRRSSRSSPTARPPRPTSPSPTRAPAWARCSPRTGPGEFMVNWTFVYANYKGLVGSPGGPADEQEFEDLGWARYPQTVEGEDVQAADRRHRHRRRRLLRAPRLGHGGGRSASPRPRRRWTWRSTTA